MTNHEIIDCLVEHVHSLAPSGRNLFRSRALRTAIMAIQRLEVSLSDLYMTHGRAGLEEIPGIGASLSFTLERLLLGDPSPFLDEPDHPAHRLSSLPGVGRKLRERLKVDLGLRDTEQLARLNSRGELGMLPVSESTRQRIQTAFEKRDTLTRSRNAEIAEPSVATMLSIDRLFRSGKLPTSGVEVDGWLCKARFADHALAHRLQRTRDWVIVEFARRSFSDSSVASMSRTVVTETEGELTGKRVVRGREEECREYPDNPSRSDHAA